MDVLIATDEKNFDLDGMTVSGLLFLDPVTSTSLYHFITFHRLSGVVCSVCSSPNKSDVQPIVLQYYQINTKSDRHAQQH
jgi:predicted AlkP superfamily phosphohydrolase/phosphomutase